MRYGILIGVLMLWSIVYGVSYAQCSKKQCKAGANPYLLPTSMVLLYKCVCLEEAK